MDPDEEWVELEKGRGMTGNPFAINESDCTEDHQVEFGSSARGSGAKGVGDMRMRLRGR